MKGISIVQGGLWGAYESSISIFAWVIVTGMQLNGSDLVGLLSLYYQSQSHTRWSTYVFCPIAVTLNQ